MNRQPLAPNELSSPRSISTGPTGCAILYYSRKYSGLFCAPEKETSSMQRLLSLMLVPT